MEKTNALYVVATPIGNLADITYRAVSVLKTVDAVFSEDTRQTKKLFDRYQISTPLKSYRDQNHERAWEKILDMLRQGKTIALVSDSGTPLISDPGYKLVKSVIGAGYLVVPIPGPSAVIASLSASGLPTDKFAFVGFLPKSHGKRAELLQEFGKLDATLIIYESPYRVIKLLQEILATLGDREVCLAGEITKLFEKFDHGKAGELLAKLATQKIRGEYTVLVSKVI
ncbi:16S rRNA (cytidine(1402)-2'-O)-methyltransferase [candidate division WWE3 bacterium CG08_land_8_20_14_0_20_41_10]|uniref:Ribosomal RNA small subunit methyltransferase I n=1 Tax=candidate division WWE3 bacterium CG08_land_8_20_14_0_20_41_10 TaxID=1975085 RepID=A0A2H0XAR7_UNCKA|nr:MAG: 16S rRNA (cytidine(1402)-2'-O)-methyltransferase [candidate division WWE3 bacterium CG08_land_8_20_14_0_20_41_10]